MWSQQSKELGETHRALVALLAGIAIKLKIFGGSP